MAEELTRAPLAAEEWTRDFADLGEPPDGLESVQVGQRIELIENGLLVGLVEVIAEWTRPESRP